MAQAVTSAASSARSKNQILNGYEATYIFSPEVSDESQKSFLEKIKGIIANHNGTFIQFEDWGRRKLAYPIRKESRGSYQYLVFSGDNKLVAELERNMRINESIMRFLTVRLERDFDANEYKKRPSVNAPVERHNLPTERQFDGGELS